MSTSSDVLTSQPHRGPAAQMRADGFYEPNGSPAAEAARLREMAALADATSLAALAPVVDRVGVVVADVGAGDSTSLGTALTRRNSSLVYVPVDIRPSAVTAHRGAGFDGRVGPATDLPIADGSVDAVHARFVFGWLDPAARRRAVEEMVRVSRGGGRVVIVDYDWCSADGPDVVVAWKDRLLSLLTGFGFDPCYGRRVTVDVRDGLDAAGLDPTGVTFAESRSALTAPLREAMATITRTVAPVVERLRALGLVDDAAELTALHAAIDDHARRQPDAPVTFPTIVAIAVDIDATTVADAVTTIRQRRTARRRTAATRRLPPAGPPGLGVVRLQCADLIDQARRLHAAEYLQHGHLSGGAIDADGFLVADIDPPDLIARSSYLGVVDNEGLLDGCVRMVRPADGDITTLPTLGKLAVTHGPATLTGLPFPPGSVVFEVSGLARSSRCHDRAITTRLLLAIACEARRCGDHYAVMGVVDTTAKMLEAVYGVQAIRPLVHREGTITLTGTGIRRGGVTLVPYYSETATFFGDLLRHCRARPEHELSRLNQPLIELASAAFADDLGELGGISADAWQKTHPERFESTAAGPR